VQRSCRGRGQQPQTLDAPQDRGKQWSRDRHLRHGGNVEAKANSKGRRSTAGDEGLSPPADTDARRPLSSEKKKLVKLS